MLPEKIADFWLRQNVAALVTTSRTRPAAEGSRRPGGAADLRERTPARAVVGRLASRCNGPADCVIRPRTIRCSQVALVNTAHDLLRVSKPAERRAHQGKGSGVGAASVDAPVLRLRILGIGCNGFFQIAPFMAK